VRAARPGYGQSSAAFFAAAIASVIMVPYFGFIEKPNTGDA